jgi:eukaryotic-like serine/threonine-protein kinase
MRVPWRSVSVAAVMALWIGVAGAQPRFEAGFGREPLRELLRQESVQKELKLTPEQMMKLQQISEKMRKKFRATVQASDGDLKKVQALMAENEKACAAVLTPDQGERLKQIFYQRQGALALADPEVAKPVQLSDLQQKKIREINEETGRQVSDLWSAAAATNPYGAAYPYPQQPGYPGGYLTDKETLKKMTELRQVAVDKVLKVLTDAQKSKWKEMQGEPFKGEIRFGPSR